VGIDRRVFFQAGAEICCQTKVDFPVVLEERLSVDENLNQFFLGVETTTLGKTMGWVTFFSFQ
jgi:hypothetical protein